VLRVGVSGAFVAGLGEVLAFALGDSFASGNIDGGFSQTIDCGLGFGFGLPFTSGTEGLTVDELDAFAGLGLTLGLLVVVSGLEPVKWISTVTWFRKLANHQSTVGAVSLEYWSIHRSAPSSRNRSCLQEADTFQSVVRRYPRFPAPRSLP
jgi:hypothetical protein